MMSQLDEFDQMADDEGMFMDLEDMLQDDDGCGAPHMLTRTVTPETQYRKTSDAVTMALQGRCVNGEEQLITPRMASCMAMDLDLPDVAPGVDRHHDHHTGKLCSTSSNKPSANIALNGPTADLLKTPVIPEGSPLVAQVTLMDALPTPSLPAPSPAFRQQQQQGSTSTPALTLGQMVAASTAASASLAPQAPKRKRPHRRAATEGSFDFLYKQHQMEQEYSTQHKVATGEPLLGPMDPPKHDPLNVMAHSFLKQEQYRLVTGAPPPPPPPPPPLSDQAQAHFSAPAPSPFMGQAPAPGAPNPFMTAPAPAPSITMLQGERQLQEHDSIIALEGTDDHDCFQTSDTYDTLESDSKEVTNSESSSEAGDPAQPQPSRLSQFLDSLQAQADLQTQMLMEEQQQQRKSINVPPQQQQDYHDYQQQPPPTRQKRQHRRVVSDMGPSYSGYHQQFQHFQQQPFDMSDMIEDRALWMK